MRLVPRTLTWIGSPFALAPSNSTTAVCASASDAYHTDAFPVERPDASNCIRSATYRDGGSLGDRSDLGKEVLRKRIHVP